ncbi:26525_t:CDS:1, partial [Dentiscutata erythropus]
MSRFCWYDLVIGVKYESITSVLLLKSLWLVLSFKLRCLNISFVDTLCLAGFGNNEPQNVVE